jgi:GMP synthase (glutamine-hydrolysing)
VCFGAQVLTWTLGGTVSKAPTREVGFEPIVPTVAAHDDPLLSHYEPGDRVFQWHMDTFDLPSGAELLATGGVRNQAFRLGETTWATQFHFEIDRPEIELWLGQDPEDVETVWGKSPDRILAESDEHQAIHERKGREVFARFTRFAAGR